MKYLTYFLIIFLFWLVFTFELSLPNLITGFVVALVTTLLFGKYFVDNVRKFFQPHRYFWLLIYLFIFIWECIKANLDVAYRVLHPALPIKPGIVKIKLDISSKFGRAILANSITLTPGTITVDIIGDYIFIHWIYVHSTDPEIYSRKVSGRFEKYVKKIFE
jgi:multicomponent Na+:H+ antiporter subunit E